MTGSSLFLVITGSSFGGISGNIITGFCTLVFSPVTSSSASISSESCWSTSRLYEVSSSVSSSPKNNRSKVCSIPSSSKRFFTELYSLS